MKLLQTHQKFSFVSTGKEQCWLYFQFLTRMIITIISQGLFYREFKDVWYVYHIIGICIASGLNQCNQRLQLHKLPLS